MNTYMIKRIWVISGIIGLLVGTGCPDGDKTQDNSQTMAQTDGGLDDFAKITIRDNSKNLLFTYMLADGSFNTVATLQEVPEQAREQVIVVDTQLSPDKRRASQVLYVANLETKRKDGTYGYSLVSRYKFERDLLREPISKTGVLPPECKGLTESPPDHIVLYSTDWCGVCKAAAKYLTQAHIPFVIKDIEKDKQAEKELTCKALKAGKRPSGVPVLDVAGTLLLGFDRDQIASLAQRLKPKQDQK